MFQPSLWRLRMQALGGLLSRYKAVWAAAWAQREQWERRHWTREEAEFLPPALALQETPPSPAPRVAAITPPPAATSWSSLSSSQQAQLTAMGVWQ